MVTAGSTTVGSHTVESSLSSLAKVSIPPKIRKVNNYVIFYDEVIGKGAFGTMVKVQLAKDLIGPHARLSGK